MLLMSRLRVWRYRRLTGVSLAPSIRVKCSSRDSGGPRERNNKGLQSTQSPRGQRRAAAVCLLGPDGARCAQLLRLNTGDRVEIQGQLNDLGRNFSSISGPAGARFLPPSLRCRSSAVVSRPFRPFLRPN